MRRVQTIRGLLPILDADWLEHGEWMPTDGLRHLHTEPESLVQTVVRHLGRSTVSAVQLRCKDTPQRCAAFVALWVDALRRHCPQITIIINDHVELAVQLAADGVHVGQEDMPVARCRQLLGADKLVGLSTHNLAEVRAANQAEVDYIGFGPLFATQTKPDAQAAQGLEQLAAICQLATRPVVAIGGIQATDMAQVAATGATAAAMISGLWGRKENREGWQQRLQEAEEGWHAGHRSGRYQV
ncbi:MAG: thiamine phosphate synthase [Magnetococcales bacterium]|nr:thiamine phosphate synthase [Magnetococcales bacterium]